MLEARDLLFARLLQYREVSKLKSTYVDVLPQLVDERTQRIRVRDVALENNQAPGLRVAQKLTFRIGECGP